MGAAHELGLTDILGATHSLWEADNKRTLSRVA